MDNRSCSRSRRRRRRKRRLLRRRKRLRRLRWWRRRRRRRWNDDDAGAAVDEDLRAAGVAVRGDHLSRRAGVAVPARVLGRAARVAVGGHHVGALHEEVAEAGGDVSPHAAQPVLRATGQQVGVGRAQQGLALGRPRARPVVLADVAVGRGLLDRKTEFVCLFVCLFHCLTSS